MMSSSLSRFSIIVIITAVIATACDSAKVVEPPPPKGAPNPEGKLYVLNQTSGTIYVFDTKTFSLTDSLDAQAPQPHYIDFSPDKRFYYVVSLSVPGVITKYDAVTNAKLGSVQPSPLLFPSAIAFNGDGSFGYICDFTAGVDRGFIYKIDLNAMTLVDSIQNGAQSHDLKNTSDGKYVVACNRNTDDVVIINTQTDQATVVPIDPDVARPPSTTPAYGPFGVAIGPNDSLAYIACITADQIRVVDIAAAKVVDSIDIPHIHSDRHPHGPTLMSVSPDNSLIGVTTQWSDHYIITSLKTRQTLAEIEFETGRSFGTTVSSDGSRIYVACVNIQNQTGRIYAIDGITYQKVDSIDVGLNSMGLVWQGL